MDRAQLADWVARYESAWRSPGTEALAGLFTPDATYSTRPYETPHRGLAAIARMWEAERPAGEQFDISTEIVAVESDTGVVPHRGPVPPAPRTGVSRPLDRPA